MESSTILKKINQEVENFKSKQVTIVPGLFFNQYETTLNNFFYYNSKYRTGDIDDEGDRKYFLNITKNPCKIFTKAVDFDTKNIRLLTTGGGDPLKTWFMERDLKYWMRDQQFGKVLNRIFRELPIFGSVVIKVVNNKLYFVDIRNFVVQQQADDLDSSLFLIEMHNYTPDEFKSIGKDMKWSQTKIDDTIRLFYETKGASHIKLYEYYGTVEEIKGQTKSYPYKRIFIADVGNDTYDDMGNMIAEHPGVELASEEWTSGHPYWEFHAEKMPGRWLGIGVVETLKEPQIRENELANLQSKSTYWAALRVFQTRDQSGANRNVKNDLKNGDIMATDAEITQIDMSDRNLAFFNEEHTKWMRNRDELTFSYDVVQGERLPAGTPLGSAQLAVSQTMSYFDGIQENIALDIKELLYSVIIPQFEKENTAEHTLRLVGQDLDQYISMVKNELVAQEVIRLATATGSGVKFPTNEDRDAIGIAVESSIRQGKEKILTIPHKFYVGAKYDIDIDITGESVDTRVRYATRFAILQAISADPTMLQDPVKKKFLYGMAEDGGINPSELFGAESPKMEEMVGAQTGRAGGGVSAPALGNKVAGSQTQTV